MPKFLYQSLFVTPQVPATAPDVTAFPFLGPDFVSRRKKRFIVGEFSYPIQFTAPVSPDVLVNLDGFVFKKSKSKKSINVETFQNPITSSWTPSVPIHTGYYEEIFDFGLTINNVIVNLDWNVINIVGLVSIQVEIRTSTDSFNWTAFQTGSSVFASSMRFAHVKFTFTTSDYKSAIEMVNLSCALSVKYETDQGLIAALSTDASGTRIPFNKAFKQAVSVTLTPQTNTVTFAAYNNLDATGCNVFAYDTSGNRVSCSVTWIARGIM